MYNTVIAVLSCDIRRYIAHCCLASQLFPGIPSSITSNLRYERRRRLYSIRGGRQQQIQFHLEDSVRRLDLTSRCFHDAGIHTVSTVLAVAIINVRWKENHVK